MTLQTTKIVNIVCIETVSLIFPAGVLSRDVLDHATFSQSVGGLL